MHTLLSEGAYGVSYYISEFSRPTVMSLEHGSDQPYKSKLMGLSTIEADRTTILTMIQPPIHTGEGFSDVILGKDKFGVAVREVITTDEGTVFYIESTHGSVDERQIAVSSIADRIVDLANNPYAAQEMMTQNLYPTPQHFYGQAAPNER